MYEGGGGRGGWYTLGLTEMHWCVPINTVTDILIYCSTYCSVFTYNFKYILLDHKSPLFNFLIFFLRTELENMYGILGINSAKHTVIN